MIRRLTAARAALVTCTAILSTVSVACGEDEFITMFFSGHGHSTFGQQQPGVWDYGQLSFSIAEGRVFSNPNTPPRVTESYAQLAGEFYTPWRNARLEVGRTYHLVVAMDAYIQPGPVYPLFKLPPGYQLVEPDPTIHGQGSYPWPAGSYPFRIMPMKVEGESARAGAPERLSNGKLSWGVSLGSLGNGTSAGSLRLLDVAYEPNWDGVVTPAGLKCLTTLDVYETPAGSASPLVPGAPRQIMAPEALLHIHPTSTTVYELQFYDPTVFTETDYPYNVSGKVPFVVYEVKRLGSTQLQITSKTYDTGSTYPGTPTRIAVASIQRTGSWTTSSPYVWTVKDWNTSGQTQLVENKETWNITSAPNPASSTAYTYSGDFVVQKPGTTPVVATAGSRTMVGKTWGEAPTFMREGASGDTTAPTTTFTYYEDANDEDSYSRIKSLTRSDGSWEAYEYYGPGEGGTTNGGMRIHRPFKDAPASVPSDLPANTSGVVTKYWYEPVAPANDPYPQRLTKVETRIDNVLAGKTEFSYYSSSSFEANSRDLIRTTRLDWVENNQGTALKTVTRYYEGLNDGYRADQLFSIERPDKTKTVFVYQKGTWSGSAFSVGSGAATRIVAIHGTSDPTVGVAAPAYDGYALTSTGDSVSDVFRLVAGQSTAEVTIRDARARVVRTESRVWANDGGGNAWHTIAWKDYSYSTCGLLSGVTASSAGGATITEYSATYVGELKKSETDATGVVVDYFTGSTLHYDAAGRVTDAIRKGSGGTPELVPAVTTTYDYDAAARIKQQVVSGGTSGTLTTSRIFDASGRLTSESVPGASGAITTEIDYDPSQRTVTVTLPTAKTQIETRHRDGTIKSITGTGTLERAFDYAVESDGKRKVTSYVGTTSSPRRQETWLDWVGRTNKTSTPGFSWNGQPDFVIRNLYSSTTGQLVQQKRETPTGTPLLADLLYEYDSMGRLKRSGLDVTTSGTLTLSSLDRITDYAATISEIGDDWWLIESTTGYLNDNSSDPTTLSNVQTRLSGFATGQLAESKVTDAEFNLTTTKVSVSGKTLTTTTTTSGVDSTEPATTVVTNGLTTSVEGFDGLEYKTQYDGLLRPWKLTDPRLGATFATGADHQYYSNSTFVKKVTDPAGKTVEYEYDNAGRLTAVKDQNGKYTRNDYDDLGRIKHRWGDATYGVEYGYDPTYGDLTTQKTFRGGSGWNSATWSGVTPGTADTTTYVYNAASGLLHQKVYADGGTMEVYWYNARGQVSYRSWSRRRVNHGYANPWSEPEAALITRYDYYDATGELKQKRYNDDTDPYPTPDLKYTYTRAGQLKQVSYFTNLQENGTGTAHSLLSPHTFTYNTGMPWRLDREELGAFYGNRWLTPLYQAANTPNGTGGVDGLAGRAGGFQLGTSSDRDSELGQTWQYFANGRFKDVLSSYDGGNTRTFTYGYLASSHLVETLTVNGGASPFITRHYEANRNVLDWIKADWTGTGTVARFDYAYNNRGQREWEKRSGTSFEVGGSPVTVDYQYNDRGELTKALTYLGTESAIGNASKRMPNLQHEYDYDNFGNRTSANQTGDSSASRIETFTSNQHNQITARENESVFASGTVASGASVAVSGDGTVAPPARQGLYWSHAHTPNNAFGADWVEFTIHAAQSGAVRTETRSVLVPKRTQTLTYDEDGNLKNDGVWAYSWDGENRLSAAEMLSSTPAGATRRKVEFAYDYLGRRVQKKAFTWSGSAWQLQSATRFLYDGWNLIAEYDAPNGTSIENRKRTYTWGLDTNGSLAPTGGAGALLQITHYNSSGNPMANYLPAYDGNGNLVALYDAAGNGTAAAIYEYSPFGELLRCEGPYAKENPFRFSTKYTDDETGLIYYGHRHYSPALGRFINRDPIREAGGLNLYALAGNDPVNRADVLGLGFFDWLFGGGNSDNSPSGPSPFDNGIIENPLPTSTYFAFPDSWSFYPGNYWDRVFEQARVRKAIEAENKKRLNQTAAANEEHETLGQVADRFLLVQVPADVILAHASPTGSDAGKDSAANSVLPPFQSTPASVASGVAIPTDDAALAAALTAELKKTATGRAILRDLKRRGIKLYVFDQPGGPGGYYNGPYNSIPPGYNNSIMINLNGRKDLRSVVDAIVHECRHGSRKQEKWQKQLYGPGGAAERGDTAEIIKIKGKMEADAYRYQLDYEIEAGRINHTQWLQTDAQGNYLLDANGQLMPDQAKIDAFVAAQAIPESSTTNTAAAAGQVLQANQSTITYREITLGP